VLQAEHATLEPPMLTDANDAAAALANFEWFCDQETDASGRSKILRLISERVTVDDARIALVTPREGIPSYFQFGRKRGGKKRERRGSIREFPPHDIEIRLEVDPRTRT
jgi:hypothetical protein